VTEAAHNIKNQKSPLHELHALLAEDMEQVNAEIMDKMHSPVELIPRIARYLIASGGKRLRPLLTLAAARLYDYQGSAHIKLATAVEFIHTATLLHDDVVDESDMRRGQASANEVYGNQSSVLVGDFLFSKAFQLMVDCGSLSVLNCLANASATIAEGEVLQLTTQGNLDTSVVEYMKVIEGKTAALFSAATSSGAMLAGADETAIQALYDYGHNLGIAFQITDDILDYKSDTKDFGKAIGDDFHEGKMTLPVLIAYQSGDDEEKEFWQRTMVDLDQNDDDLPQALSYMKAHSALTQSLDVARTYANKAKASLDGQKNCIITQCLIELTDFILGRVS